jgi:hypothetical protein
MDGRVGAHWENVEGDGMEDDLGVCGRTDAET